MDVERDLARIRRRAGLSQRALARRTGIPQSTLARIESGANRARLDTLEKILAVLDHGLAIEPRPRGDLDRSLIVSFMRLSPRRRIEYATAAGATVAGIRARLTVSP